MFTHDRRGLAGSVKTLELQAGAVDFLVKLTPADEAAFVFFEVGEAALVFQPTFHALFGHDVGEGLVEDRVAPAEVFAVGEFVENRLCEIDVRVGDEGVEHRIVEPAEGGVGVHLADENIVAVALQFPGERLGVLLPEVAAVVHFSDERVVPGLGFEGKLGGRVEHPDHVFAAEIRVFCVAFISRQREMITGKLPDAIHGLQLPAQHRRSRWIGDDLLVRPTFPKDFHLSPDRLPVKSDRLAGREERHDQGGEEDGKAGHGRISNFGVTLDQNPADHKVRRHFLFPRLNNLLKPRRT